MITLLADRPAQPHAREMEQFGRLAGLWETAITYYPPDGSPARTSGGDWEFGYALEGRAVIDVWQVPSRSVMADRERSRDEECGLCVRIWDPSLQLWRFTYHGTARGDLVHMFARQIGDELVLEGAQGADLVRWTFSNIQADAFEWRGERSTHGGTWRLEQQVRAQRAQRPSSPARCSELAAVLLAPAPHPSLSDQAHVFDRFVGAWRCEYTHFAPDGSLSGRYPGSVTFGWVLDGYAMQDVWIGEPGGEVGERSIGTSLRYFDAERGLWTIYWFAPQGGLVTVVEGGALGERIVLTGENADGSLRRWSFDEIRHHSFVWRGERSGDRGETWQLTAEYRMSRLSGSI